MSAPALRVRGLTKRFGPAVAVDGVDLEVEAGRFTCLIGPSGCGKTTLLRMLAGLEAASSGSIEIDGREVADRSPAERGVGMVFQSYALFPNMSVAENVAFGASRRLRGAARKARVEALLGTVGLDGLGRRRPHELSGGQQQRVAIARALATEPWILLLDEPLSALDPVIREQLRGELKALQRRLGVTTVMVTHDQAEALAVADCIAVMRGGRIEQVGSPEAIYHQPASLFVAGFLGAANVIEATTAGARGLRLWGRIDAAAETCGRPCGAAVTAVIRPEAVRLAVNGEAGIPARVVDRRFAGSVVRLETAPEAAPDQVIVLDVPAGSATAPGIGERAMVVLPPEQLRLFPHADAAQ